MSIGGGLLIDHSDPKPLQSVYLPSLTTVGDDLLIRYDLPHLSHVSMDNLSSIGGSLEIKNAGVDTVTFPSLTTLGGNLSIAWMELDQVRFDSLDSVSGFLAVQSTEEVVFPSTISIGGQLNLSVFSSTSTINFPVLEEVGEDLYLFWTEAEILMPSLTRVGSIDIHTMSHPSGEWSLSALEYVEGDLDVDNAYSMELAFSSLHFVGGTLQIGDLYGNPQILGFNLPRLNEVAGSIIAHDNGGIEELSWSDLRAVGGSLAVYANTVLSDVSGLHSIETIGGDFYFVGNPQLSDWAAQSLVDSIGMANIGGTVTIYGNGP